MQFSTTLASNLREYNFLCLLRLICLKLSITTYGCWIESCLPLECLPEIPVNAFDLAIPINYVLLFQGIYRTLLLTLLLCHQGQTKGWIYLRPISQRWTPYLGRTRLCNKLCCTTVFDFAPQGLEVSLAKVSAGLVDSGPQVEKSCTQLHGPFLLT